MKRIIALLLCTAIVFALAACGSDETPATTAPAILVTEPPAETAAPTDAPSETIPAPTETRTLLENAVLFDNADASFTIIKTEDSEGLIKNYIVVKR